MSRFNPLEWAAKNRFIVVPTAVGATKLDRPYRWSRLKSLCIEIIMPGRFLTDTAAISRPFFGVQGC